MSHAYAIHRVAGRRAVLKGVSGLAGLTALQACAPSVQITRTAPPVPPPPAPRRGEGPPMLVPMRISRDQLIDIKCCIRPLRAAGPNLATEQVGDALVIHNYGHGGSGWSLSWGSAEIAVGKALSTLPSEIAVVGCGIIGLTTAVVAQRAGLKVTIYAREMIQRTRSFRASGSYTPGSRIALAEPAGPQFAEQWEMMARLSWKAFRTCLGLPGKPVEFGDSYALSDKPLEKRKWPADPAITGSWATTGLPQQNSEFAHLDERIKDIVPQPVDLSAEENPFALPYAQRTSQMHFNFPSYAQMLLSEFFGRGGQFVMRDFHGPAELGRLPQKVVIHCTGYAARDLWQDKTIIPVRGQTGWLVPQTEANYSVRYKNVSLLSKADGVVIMNNNPDLGDMLGVGNAMELANLADIEAGLAIIAPALAPRQA
ncbi:FAD-dependent oxidoreductase [Novosphingobium piscinae]|nr:FAD-dependent oxidoreductase [Novosphingobium piscinae]